MVVNKELDDILCTYENYHNGIIEGNIIEISINYHGNTNIDISLVTKENKTIKDKVTETFKDDFDFNTYVLPKIIQRVLTKNDNITKRIIMGTSDFGNIIISRIDNKETLIIRNCSKRIMTMVEKLEESNLKLKEIKSESNLDIDSENNKYEKYLAYNIALDYAKYRQDFIEPAGKANFFDATTYKSYLEQENRSTEKNIDNLILLDIARYAYRMGIDTQTNSNYTVFDELELYNNDPKIKELCRLFRNNDKKDSIAKKALTCAEYERNNEVYINENIDIIKEALDATSNGVVYGNDNFLGYWDGRRRYYRLLGNNELVKICNDFLNSNRLSINNEEKEKSVASMENKKKVSLIAEMKKVKENSRPDFSTIINDPIETKEEFSSGSLFRDEEHEILAIGAEEQAARLLAAINERDQIKKDAEEFAKIILKNQRERKEIVKAAEEQARKILELEKENEELKRLAEDNARSIIEREKKYAEEVKLRELEINKPINKADIDKINNLLNAISMVKDLDFAVNHPTVMQEVNFLEEKIITYLSTHRNIISKDEFVEEQEETFVPEKKSPPELLSIIRNVYTTSHNYEKEGRHTLINIAPTQDEKYKVVLYSVKHDTDDILTEAYFDKEFFKEDTIRELCDIFTKDAVLVASKTDNMPNNLADYLVIDNQDNAIKFMGCSQEIIEIAKAYL